MKLVDALATVKRRLLPHGYSAILAKELKGCDSILDLGCGKASPIRFVEAGYKVGVERYPPYILQAKRQMTHDTYVLGDITKLQFASRSFDGVIALEVIEHLTREDGFKLIKNMVTWARKKVIVSTPNGFQTLGWLVPIDGNVLQVHNSRRIPQDFENLGFKVYGATGWHYLRKVQSKIKSKKLWILSLVLSQIATFRIPKMASDLICVKTSSSSNARF